MGTYLDLEAKRGCEDQINELYRQMTGNPNDFLVYSDEVIRSEIEYIHSPAGESQAHMRPWLRTVQDWNMHFPTCRSGTGQIRLTGVGEMLRNVSNPETKVDEEVQRVLQTQRDVQFVLDNRLLFKKIWGLDEARQRGLTDFGPGDGLIDGKPVYRPRESEVGFSELPRGKCEVYRLCVKHNRPDLWKAYVEFAQNPNRETWRELRSKCIPWHGLSTVWQRVERVAQQQDGKDYGLLGRFREGRVPTQFQLRLALRPPRQSNAA